MSGTIDWDPGDALIFARVVDEGSFTAASEVLDLPKSTVSRRVSRLETELGLQLMRRTTRSLTLTDAGRAFYAQASHAAEALHAAEQAATSVLSEPRGRLRVTAPAHLGTEELETLLAFSRACPDVHLEVNLTNSIVDIIEQGYDAALRGGRKPMGPLTGHPLVVGEIHIVASPSYLKKRGVPKRARDLANHDCILFPSFMEESSWELTGKHGKTLVPIEGRLTVNNLEAVRRAALGACGLALLPEGHCAADVRDGSLKRVLPGLHRENEGMWIVYPRTRFLSAKVRAFIEFMRGAYD